MEREKEEEAEEVLQPGAATYPSDSSSELLRH